MAVTSALTERIGSLVEEVTATGVTTTTITTITPKGKGLVNTEENALTLKRDITSNSGRDFLKNNHELANSKIRNLNYLWQPLLFKGHLSSPRNSL